VVLPLRTIRSEDPITPELSLNISSTSERGGVQSTNRFEHVVKLLALLKGHKSGRQHILDIFRVHLRIVNSLAVVRPCEFGLLVTIWGMIQVKKPQSAEVYLIT
jgi:hypothetical protein